MSFQFSRVIISSLSDFAYVKTEIKTPSVQHFLILPLSTQKLIWIRTEALALLQVGHRLWWEAFSFSDQLSVSQVSTALSDYPDIRSPSGRQVTARWTTSLLRQQDIPETQLLQQNNSIFAQAPRLAGWQHISAVQHLWAYYATNSSHTFPFRKHLFPFSRWIVHTIT